MNRGMATLLVLLLVFGCGGNPPEESSDSWVVDQRGARVSQGRYVGSYNIIQDTCKKKLSDIMSSDFSPDVNMVIKNSTFSDSYRGLEWFNMLRTASLGQFISIRIDPGGHAINRVIEERLGVTEALLMCEPAGNVTQASTYEMTLYSERDDELRLWIKESWQKLAPKEPSCQSGYNYVPMKIPTEYFPDEDCVDEYEITYKLKEPCPVGCEIDYNITYEEEDPYKRATASFGEDWCTCPEQRKPCLNGHQRAASLHTRRNINVMESNVVEFEVSL